MKPNNTVSLLLTNLRLLGYDFDAFPINADVFTSLTNKGKAFEHIIYHLFNTFDPEECAQKLQGCWPVYEPAQARELRNVAFKWLEDLKKSGRLGGVLVRRTTLDDCCGQRYEELLLALSTMVLKDQVESGGYPGYILNNTAYHQAVSTQPSSLYLTPLTIAHRYALGSLLEARRNAKEQWETFERILDEKEAELASMAEKIPDDEEAEKPEEPKSKRQRDYEESIRRKWENNWLGDPRWLDLMLNGDPEPRRDRFLELSFEQAFENNHYFADGRVASPPAISLKGLENQVAEQRRRVAEIRRLRELTTAGASSPMKSASPSKRASVQAEEKKGLKIEFTKHQNLHLKDMAEAPRRNGSHRSEYADLLNSLREEMMLVSAPSQRARERPEVPVYYSYDGPEQSAPEDYDAPAELSDGPEEYHLSISPQEGNGNENGDANSSLGEGDDEGEFHNDLTLSFLSDDQGRHPHLIDTAMDLDDMDVDQQEEPQSKSAYYPHKHSPTLSRQFEVEAPNSASTTAFGSYLNSAVNSDDEGCGSLPTSSAAEQVPQITHQESTPTQSRNPRLRQSLAYDAKDELFAEQLVSNIAAASFSPSPVKAPVSRVNGIMPWNQPVEPSSPSGPVGGFDDFEDSTMSLPHEDSNTSMRLPHEDSTMSSPQSSPHLDHDHDDRTMQSPIPDGRASQQSLAPPDRILPTASTPTEELLASGDYNSVFKSRPRIALSPTFSPSPHKGSVGGLNLSMSEEEIRNAGDDNDDDDERMEYMTPLVSKFRR